MSFIKTECNGETKQELSLEFITFQATMRYGEVESISGRFIPLREEQRIAYLLNRRLVWPLSRSCSFVEEKNLLSLLGNEAQFIGRPVRSLFTASTEVSMLLIGLTETNEFTSQTEMLTMRTSIRRVEEYRRLNMKSERGRWGWGVWRQTRFHFTHTNDHLQGDRDEFQFRWHFNVTSQNHQTERKLTGLILQYTLMGRGGRINPKIRLNIWSVLFVLNVAEHSQWTQIKTLMVAA
jgi:hypothetical protein